MRLTATSGLVVALVTVASANPMHEMFPGKSGCYARSYSIDHLTAHPDQLVTAIALTPEDSVADPMIGLWIDLKLRGDIAGTYLGLGYCEAAGARLACGMEGDAGSFTISPEKDGSILVEVGPYGMSFEAETGFVTLMGDRGDDRSFLLHPSPCN